MKPKYSRTLKIGDWASFYAQIFQEQETNLYYCVFITDYGGDRVDRKKFKTLPQAKRYLISCVRQAFNKALKKL